MRSEKQYVEKIASALDKAKIKYERERAISGLRPDFTVYGPRNHVVVLEAKAWDPRGGNTARALKLASLYEVATEVDRAYVVLPESARNYAAGVVNLDGLIEALEEYLESAPPKGKKPRLGRRKPRRMIFAAMPFASQYDDTFVVAISHAAKRCRAFAQRVDHIAFSRSADEEARRLIAESAAVVVDLSESRPNVLYEAGYAHALKKPTVHISSTPRKDLPFNVRNWPTLQYHVGGSAALAAKLARRLEKLI